MVRLLGVLCTLVVFTATFGVSDSYCFPIDTFAKAQHVVDNTTGAAISVGTVTGSGIVGGERKIQLQLRSGISASASVAAASPRNFFQYQAFVGSKATTSVFWDKMGATTFTAFGRSAIKLRIEKFDYTDNKSLLLRIQIGRSGEKYSQYLLKLERNYSNEAVIIPFKDFTNSHLGGVDFTNVTGFSIHLSGDADNFRMNCLEVWANEASSSCNPPTPTPVATKPIPVCPPVWGSESGFDPGSSAGFLFGSDGGYGSTRCVTATPTRSPTPTKPACKPGSTTVAYGLIGMQVPCNAL